MGTWGVWPTQSDSAADFLGELRAVSSDDRVDRIRGMLLQVVAEPEIVGRLLVPEEVLAAAVVVAAPLEGGDTLPWSHEKSLVLATIPEESARELRSDAASAIEAAISYGDGWWYSSWVGEDDRSAAIAGLGALRDVLNRAP